MNNVINQNGKVLKETLASSNSNAVRATLRGFTNLSPPICHFVKYIIEYYIWLNRLRYQIKIARLPVQFSWALELA